ncbi:glycoside hydrolase family 32 protein [Fontibacter flavus]|uniref:Glycoside hydrolase family 32 protein n=1 Tax=Fontibacter flavus TaxID=654838 RepID=A0ABV6FQR5_9BACT
MITKNKLVIALLCTAILSCGQKSTELQSVSKPMFNEPFRPQFHFSPPSNWMNDPNGMVYLDGEYHLFYQYHPDGNTWGPMHWGHAISEDLVYWEHFPIALFPDEHGTIFSGSAVVDYTNSSGLGSLDNPPMVAIFTYHDAEGEKSGRNDYQSQGIAYSTDKGRTWEKYHGNPVLKSPGINDFRDPKVIWHEESSMWVMSLAVKDRISFYTSPNLIDWQHRSDFNPEWAAYGGVWECPDLFPLTASTGEEKWVLLVSINPGGPNGGSATQYFIGDFDGKVFNTETNEIKWIDYGADNYAGVTWSDIPKEDGRRLFIGWMSNWLYAQEVPTEIWRSSTTIARELNLSYLKDDYVLTSKPVDELKKLRRDPIVFNTNEIELPSELLEIELKASAEDFKLTFLNDKGEQVIFEKIQGKLFFDRSNSTSLGFHKEFNKMHTAPATVVNDEEIRIFLDRSSIEVFLNQGEIVFTELIFPSSPYSKLVMQGIEPKSIVYPLKSIWGN